MRLTALDISERVAAVYASLVWAFRGRRLFTKKFTMAFNAMVGPLLW